MEGMFEYSGITKANLSNWKLHQNVLNNFDSRKKMFDNCSKLEYLKTPVGLKTTISGANSNFKIVKLKKGSPVSVEKESQNLNAEYTINSSGDKDAMYHIYRKDKYAGVTFDKNGGDSEAWVNHEIAEKGKSIKQSGGVLPEEEPEKRNHEFKGWDKNAGADTGSFTENTAVNVDTDVYAVWKTNTKITISFDANGGSGNMPVQQVDKDSNYTLPECNFTAPAGKEFDKWLVTVGTAQEVEKLPNENVVASEDIIVKAMWRNAPVSGKVNVIFNANGGAGSMPTKQINKDSEYTLPVCGYTAPAGKEFDKWLVTISMII